MQIIRNGPSQLYNSKTKTDRVSSTSGLYVGESTETARRTVEKGQYKNVEVNTRAFKYALGLCRETRRSFISERRGIQCKGIGLILRACSYLHQTLIVLVLRPNLLCGRYNSQYAQTRIGLIYSALSISSDSLLRASRNRRKVSINKLIRASERRRSRLLPRKNSSLMLRL